MKYLLNLLILIIVIATLIVIISLCTLPRNCQKYINISSKPGNVEIITSICSNTCRNSKNQKYSCNPYICYKKITQFVEINNTRYCNYIEISSNINTFNIYSNTSVYSVYYNTTHSCFFHQNTNLEQCNHLNSLFLVALIIFISVFFCFVICCCYIRYCDNTNKLHELSGIDTV